MSEYERLQQRITDGLRELREMGDFLTEDPEFNLTIDQKLELTKRLLKVCEVLNP